ncbi:MAG: hypothetical protein WB992_15630, partial [Bryobacteraceae bacterium]
MKISRTEIAARTQERIATERRARAASRGAELVWLIAASAVLAVGLWLVYRAKTYNVAEQEKQTLNLNELSGPQQLIPYLNLIAAPSDQDFVANRIYNLKRHGERFSNVGALARLRVTEADLTRSRGLSSFAQRFAESRERRQQREEERQARLSWFSRKWESFRGGETERVLSIPLLTPAEFAAIKPHFRVRNAGDYNRQFFSWIGLFFAAFWVTHVLWRVRSFAGDHLLFPLMFALSGIGLILMISLRDPLRDMLLFSDFTQGVIAGCAALLIFSIPDYERHFGKLSYVPLLAAFL